MALLIEAIRNGRFKQLQLALQAGWDVNARDPVNLRTPLIELSYFYQEATAVRLCKRFLDKGAKIGLRDKDGRNALLHACLKSRIKLVEVMLKEDEGLNLNDRDHYGNTALLLAVTSGNIVVVSLLVKALKRYKLSLDVCNNHGETPLILASQTRMFLISEILISEGNASTEIRDKRRYLTAKEWKSVKVTKMTREGGFPLSSPEKTERPFSCNSGSKSSTLEIPSVDYSCGRRSLKFKAVTKNGYKAGEFNKLFDIYSQQLTTSYCPSVIRPKLKDDCDVSDISVLSEYDDYYSTCPLNYTDHVSETCPVPLSNKKRFCISKAAQTPISVKRIRRRQLLASTDKAKNQKGNLTSRQEQDPQAKTYRRGSINILQKIQVPIRKRQFSPPLQQERSTQNEEDEMSFLISKLDVLAEEAKVN